MAVRFLNTPKTNSRLDRLDRLTQLWQELGADPVPLQPVLKGSAVVAPVLHRQDERLPFTVIDAIDGSKPENRSWKVDLVTVFHSLLEPDVDESLSLSAAEAISEAVVSAEASLAAAHEASLALSSPFHWEPKPSWTAAPARSGPPFSNTVHPQHFAPRPKIPLRPLHKQPFYQRFFFYLRRWLSRPK